MRDVLSEIERWRAGGEDVAVATVIRTWGSAPRSVGARMAMTASGRIAGSVSGGCVEGAVFDEGTRVLASGRPKRLTFGVEDEKAWTVGLACGGRIEIFVEKLEDAVFDALRSAIAAERPVAEVTVVRGPERLLGNKFVLETDGAVAFPSGAPSGAGMDEAARRAAGEAFQKGGSRLVPGAAAGVEYFVDVLSPPPRLIVVGGAHVAIALVAFARTLGFETVVIDPRQAFGNAERFPHADSLVSEWPDKALREIGLTSSTAVAVLSHDPKLDDPALSVALRSPAFYVGALGSRKTQEKRRQRLMEAGLSAEELARLHTPIGLDIGGRSPEEIALSVIAEIVAVRNGRAFAQDGS
jgi:xanthine dehydrogenase accessory factor